MATIRGTVQDGKVVFATPLGWPDGTEVTVTAPTSGLGVAPDQADRLVMLTDEADQGDDPESIARWLEWFDSLEPLRMTSEDEAAMNEWRAKMKAFNVEAVRRQMEEGIW